MYPTIGDTLSLTARTYPDRDAIVYPRRDQRWTYAEFDRKVNRLANALADLGIEKGDRVSTMLYNGSEIALTVYACARLGAVFNPLNYRLAAGDVTYILNDADSEVLIFEDDTAAVVDRARDDLDTVGEYLFIDDAIPDYARDFYGLVESANDTPPDVEVAENDVYAFIYTSGTTGRPKGVVHEHRAMIEHDLICLAESGLGRNDVGLSCLPLYHCAELHANLFPRVHVGATNVIHHEFDPSAVLNAIDEHDVTVMFAAPTAWNALAQFAPEVDADVSSLQLGLYGAAPMPRRVLDACMEQFCEEYLQAYGMTEIGPCGTFQHPDEQLEKQGSAGVPALNHDLRIVEPDGAPNQEIDSGETGEILFAGPCTMREYHNRPEATAESLRESEGRTWYYTGDLGYLDDDGYLFVVDRKDDMIVSGGENVYPTGVEDVLFGHDDVIEAAVVGEPHDEWGERVVAYVVGEVDAADLDAYCTESDDLADFKRPREYYMVEDLPKTPSGKVKKFELREESSPEAGQAG